MSDPKKKSSILIFVVDDEAGPRELLKYQVESFGYEACAFESGQACLDQLHREPVAICLDLFMPGMNGLETLRGVKREAPDVPVIMATSDDKIESAVEAIKAGAYDYIVKPIDELRLQTTLQKAVEKYQLTNQVKQLRSALKSSYSFRNIIGVSPGMRKLFAQLEKIGESSINVCIFGETGTGKELVARAVHYQNDQVKTPFVEINCGAIPDSLQEAELFGYEKGAFTGAVDSKKGKLEMADGGTLFLDEVGEMTPATQVKLLRFLQEKSFERVGGTRKIKVNMRVVCATNKNLEEAIKEGTFRDDLYYRLVVFPLTIPPLRERKEDIPYLCGFFLKKYQGEIQKPITTIEPDALEALIRFDWPGNVRQLENAIYRAMVSAEGKTVTKNSLAPEIVENPGSWPEAMAIPTVETTPGQDPGEVTPADALEETQKKPVGTASTDNGGLVSLDDAEKQAIQAALNNADGDVPETAKALGVSRATLYRKLKKHGLT